MMKNGAIARSIPTLYTTAEPMSLEDLGKLSKCGALIVVQLKTTSLIKEHNKGYILELITVD